MRVLVIDDSAFMRGMIGRIIDAADGFELAGAARNGREGVEMARSLEPDLIVLDIEMPELDGLGTLRQIRIKCRTHAPSVLMCSSLTAEGTAEAIRALRLGAADVIAKEPSSFAAGNGSFETEMLAKLRAIAAERTRAADTDESEDRHELDAIAAITAARVDAVVIGAGAGGPPAIEDALALLPRRPRVPFVIGLRMPTPFVAGLAARLTQHCACPVVFADRPVSLTEPGVYLAAGACGLETRGHRAGSVRLVPGANQDDEQCIDALFTSAAGVFGRGLLAVQLSAAGSDGVRGAGAVRGVGGRVVVQSLPTCAFASVPDQVIRAGHADATMHAGSIAWLLRSVASPDSASLSGTGTPDPTPLSLPTEDNTDRAPERRIA